MMNLKYFNHFDDNSDIEWFYKKRIDSWDYHNVDSYVIIYNANNKEDSKYIWYVNQSSFMIRAKYRLFYNRNTWAYFSFGFMFKAPSKKYCHISVSNDVYFNCSIKNNGKKLLTVPTDVNYYLVLECWIKDGKIWYTGYVANVDTSNDQITEETPKLFHEESELPGTIDYFELGVTADYYWRPRVWIDRVALYE